MNRFSFLATWRLRAVLVAVAALFVLLSAATLGPDKAKAEVATPASDAENAKLEKQREGRDAPRALPAVAVKVRAGVDAETVAARHGGEVGFPIGSLEHWYHLDFPDVAAAESAMPALSADADVENARLQFRSRAVRKVNDPYFSEQWHLKNTGQKSGTPGRDINAEPAWVNYDGFGTVVSIVDDGVETSHPDLGGFLPAYAYDYVDNDSNPNPAAPGDDHGTAVAGLAVARGDNGTGVAGAGYGAAWTAVRLLGSNMSDSSEAAALGHALANVDIYNNSWGAPDTGDYESMGPLARSAIQNGVANGRGGKGAIYVWAGGNGHSWGDDSNLDEYASLPETIAVAAINNRADDSTYSEGGANILVTAPGGEDDMLTTDVTGAGGYNDGSVYSDLDYTDDFSGTSASAPVVSGVVALMLEANSNLTWRDVQHILVHSSDHSLIGSSSHDNGAGLEVSDRWGFGMVRADAAAEMAAQWINVPARATLNSPVDSPNTPIIDNSPGGVTRTITVPNNIFIEHVVVEFTTDHTWWGDLRVRLTSPSGTISKLATVSQGLGPSGTDTWRYTSTRHWGEQAQGDWEFRVVDEVAQDSGDLQAWRIIFYGTNTEPTQICSIGNTSLPVGVTGTSYNHTFQFNGISDGLAWSLSGNVPPGLSIDSATGTLMNTPTTAGTYDFTVEVAADSPPAYATANVSLEIVQGSTPGDGGNGSSNGGGGGGGGCSTSTTGAGWLVIAGALAAVIARRRRVTG